MVVSRQPIFVNLKSNTMKKHIANIVIENVSYKYCYNKKGYSVNVPKNQDGI